MNIGLFSYLRCKARGSKRWGRRFVPYNFSGEVIIIIIFTHRILPSEN